MDTNAIIYSLYCEYFGKSSILDSATICKAAQTRMQDNDKIYALINIVRLFVFAEFVPMYQDNLSNHIRLVNENKGEELIIGIAEFETNREKAEAYINALCQQKKYDKVSDRMATFMTDLKHIYEDCKDFTTLFNTALQGKDVDIEVIKNGLKACRKFLKQYSESLVEDEGYDNLINVVISEVKEDLEEIIAEKKLKTKKK